MAPALYYVLSPVIALLGVFFVCALLVYCVVPCGRAAGIHFNNVSKEKNKKGKAMAKIKKSLIFHLAKHGLTWQDIEDGDFSEGVRWCEAVQLVRFVHTAITGLRNLGGTARDDFNPCSCGATTIHCRRGHAMTRDGNMG